MNETPLASRVTLTLSVVAVLAAAAAAVVSIILPGVYVDLIEAGTITERDRTGALAQDIITLPLAGVMLVKAFTVCLSWGFGEWYAIANAGRSQVSLAFISTALTVISAILLVLYLRRAVLQPSAA